MSKLVRTYLPLSIVAATLGLAGCHKDTTATQDPNDPAAANVAADGTTDNTVQGAPQQPQQGYAAQPAPSRSSTRRRSSSGEAMPPEPPAERGQSSPNEYASNGGYQGSYDQSGNYDSSYEQGQYAPEYQPVYATQAPPPIPEYEQPACPGDNYQWTPGYWNYAQSGGYYWVPGVWIAAPFLGALWTPGYWGYGGDRYAFHHGYWGQHIGYYGGISYGFGYYGHGYEGGYWNHDSFFYNRAVTRVNDTNVRNVYVHSVTVNNTTINNYTTNNYTNNNINRVSYNGGQGGVTARPLPSEINAQREQHVAPLPQQVAHVQQASTNRAQFAASNGGRPQMVAAAQPIRVATQPTAAGLKTLQGRPAVPMQQFHPQPAVAQNRPGQPQVQQQRPGQPVQNAQRPEAGRPGSPAQGNERAAQPNGGRPQQETRPAPQQAARPAQQQPSRPSPQQPVHVNPPQQPAHVNPPQQPARPAYQPQAHPQPAPRPQAEQQRPQPQPHQEAQPRPAPQQHAQPQPQQHAQPHQEAQPHAEPHQEQAHPHG